MRTKLIGGLTHNQRQRFFRLQKQLRDAATNCYMRINDDYPQSRRARTLAAKKMLEAAREIYRTLAP
jgi:nicotinamide riboside kinase